MAKLLLEDGTILNNLNDVARELAPLNVSLSHWPTGDDPELVALLDKPALTDGEKETVLAKLDHYFANLKQQEGYQARDLIVIHPDIPNLDQMLAKFEKCHTHADPEVRYIVAGEGVFGFVRPDGSQVELNIEPSEYINVPAGSEHWFHLTSTRKIKAVRYFVDSSGWTPIYTGTSIRIQPVETAHAH